MLSLLYVLPCSFCFVVPVKVGDDLPTTRSGRKVVPVLAWWLGQRMDYSTNQITGTNIQVSVARTVQGRVSRKATLRTNRFLLSVHYMYSNFLLFHHVLGSLLPCNKD